MFSLILGAIALGLLFAPPRLRLIGLTVVGGIFLVLLAPIVLNRNPLPANPPAGLAPTPPTAKSTRFDFDQYERAKKDADDPEAKSRIPAAEIRFDQIQAVAGIEPGTLRSIRARLYNDSPRYSLTDYSYYLVVQDCIGARGANPAGQKCTAVYDQRETRTLDVPPGQARDVVFSIPPGNPGGSAPFHLLGEPHSELTTTDTRAYRTSATPQ